MCSRPGRTSARWDDGFSSPTPQRSSESYIVITGDDVADRILPRFAAYPHSGAKAPRRRSALAEMYMMVCRSWGRDERTAPFFVRAPLIGSPLVVLLSRHADLPTLA